MPVTPPPDHPVELFYSYSHKDEKLRSRLESHLHGLRRQGVISGWHDRRIVAGTDWGRELDLRLETAGVILLLISSDYIESDYCYGVEMKKALERYEAGAARVIPVLLRPCAWQSAPFGKLQALPTNVQPVTEWKNRDKAFLDIVEGVRRAVEEMHAARGAADLTPTYSDAAKTGEHGRWVIVISATVDEIDLDKVKAIEAHLRKLAEDTELTVMRVERGSVVLVLEGTRRGFERVSELLESGRLNDLLGYEVREVRWGFDEQRPAGRGGPGEPAADDRAAPHDAGRLVPSGHGALTAEAFDSMLAWLAPDRAAAAEKYERIRGGLVRIYTSRRSPDPEGLADETINRVVRNLIKSDVRQRYGDEPAVYFLAVARYVYREQLRRLSSEGRALLEDASRVEAAEEEAESESLALLDNCMQKLTARNRELLLSYYEGSGRERRERRQALAREQNISQHALHLKVYKLKEQLRECIRQARAGQAVPGGKK